MNLGRYATLVFDCDGVLLDSNRVKTEAFRTAARPWGAPAADALVAHHVANGGISRYEKFTHFLDHILPEHVPTGMPGRDGPNLEAMLAAYAEASRSGLMSCSSADGLTELREATSGACWMIVSGGDQAELREVFNKRGLHELFDGGIFGSPDPKIQIVKREIDRGAIRFPALFLGDSRLDHQVAVECGIDFLFVSDWTEVARWEAYVREHELQSIPSVSALLSNGLTGGCSEQDEIRECAGSLLPRKQSTD